MREGLLFSILGLEYALGGFRFNRISKYTDVRNLNINFVPGFQGNRNTGAARKDQVSRPQGHLLADVAHDLGKAE